MGLQVVHLGEEENDVYYCADYSNEKREWKRCTGIRANLGKSKLFIGKKHKFLDRTDFSKSYNQWIDKLKKHKADINKDGFNVDLNSRTRDFEQAQLIMENCTKLLKNEYDTGSPQYDQAERNVIKFCSELDSNYKKE